MDFEIEFSEDKNLLLKAQRGVNFDDVKKAIEINDVLDDIEHFNKKDYPNQRILIVKIKSYVYAVPYIIDQKRKVLFLKTVYPNRVLTKKYIKKGKDEKEN